MSKPSSGEAEVESADAREEGADIHTATRSLLTPAEWYGKIPLWKRTKEEP
jgi:hypothetical protein